MTRVAPTWTHDLRAWFLLTRLSRARHTPVVGWRVVAGTCARARAVLARDRAHAPTAPQAPPAFDWTHNKNPCVHIVITLAIVHVLCFTNIYPFYFFIISLVELL